MPLRLAIVDDYEVVVRGLAEMLRPWSAEVEVVPLRSGALVPRPVDVVLVDPAMPGRADGTGIGSLLEDPRVGKVVAYSWDTARPRVETALAQGAAAFVSKTAPAAELVEALRRVHAGETLALGLDDHADGMNGMNGINRANGSNGAGRRPDGCWPGREEGLTAREAEVIALITQGLSNQEIAERANLSINSVKSYIRTSYRKMGVTSRTHAVLWGLDHGFSPERTREPERASPAPSTRPTQSV